jgi:hypothetical protein
MQIWFYINHHLPKVVVGRCRFELMRHCRFGETQVVNLMDYMSSVQAKPTPLGWLQAESQPARSKIGLFKAQYGL